MIPSAKSLIVTSAACLAATIAAPRAAHAQVTTVVGYSFSVPIAKVVPNPCITGGFTLVEGTTTLSITAVQSTAFQLKVSLTSAGTGKDVTADGLPLIVGANPDYEYSSDINALSTFPDGIPTYFERTLPVSEYLVRNSPIATGDSYMMRMVLRLKYNNGVPAVPVLESIAVAACE